MPGGRRPGAGRPKGSRNKKTIASEHAKRAEQEITASKRAGIKLGKERLEELMEIFINAAGFFQPTLPKQIEAGAPKNPHGDWDGFEKWAVHAMNCAKEVAKYQSPQFRAIMVAPAPETNQPERRKTFQLTIFENSQPALPPPPSTPTSESKH